MRSSEDVDSASVGSAADDDAPPATPSSLAALIALVTPRSQRREYARVASADDDVPTVRGASPGVPST